MGINDKLALNAAGEKLIKGSEGLKLKAYLDPIGVPTIAWGHTEGITAQMVSDGYSCSPDQAEAWFLQDVESRAAHYVRAYVKVVLNVNQFSALVSYTFNMGSGTLFHSCILSRLNAGDTISAANDFPLYDKVFNKKTQQWTELPGLVTRRAQERSLFLTPA